MSGRAARGGRQAALLCTRSATSVHFKIAIEKGSNIHLKIADWVLRIKASILAVINTKVAKLVEIIFEIGSSFCAPFPHRCVAGSGRQRMAGWLPLLVLDTD